MATLITIIAISSAPLLILGLFIRNGKGLMLIAGYNTMPQQERDKTDENMLAKAVGNLLLRLALITALLGVTIYFEITWMTIVLVVFIGFDLSVSLVTLNREIQGKLTSQNRSSKTKVFVTIGIVSITLIGVSLMLYYGEKEPGINILDKEIEVVGMYGVTVPFTDVIDISIINKSMKEISTGRRTNGFGGFGGTLKGHFNSESIGKTLLFVNSDTPITIRIVRDGDKDIYVSLVNEERTKQLYQELVAAIQSK